MTNKIIEKKCQKLLFRLFLGLTCNEPQLFVLGLGPANFRTLLDLGGTGGGNLDLDNFKAGLARLLFNCCLKIRRPTAAATTLPLEFSRFNPLGGGVGGLLDPNFKLGNFEVDFDTFSRSNFLAELHRIFFTAPPNLTLSKAV